VAKRSTAPLTIIITLIKNTMKKITFLKMTFGALAVFVLGAPAFANASLLYRQLELGSVGSDVGSLQTFLAVDPTIYPQGLVTNYFGSLTKSAVSNFQVRNGLPGVGRVGPATLPVINAQMMNGSIVGSDRTTPSIYSLNINTGRTSAEFNWNTVENASGIVFYSTSPIPMTEASAYSSVYIGGNSFITNTNMQTSHSGTITGLESNTNYYYVVYARDASGNESLTWPQVFSTN
jgi:peptidoglycan hydrolase-like protein with peptidoglycan-binding domain